MSELTLQDLSLDDRRQLPFNHPLLDNHALSVERDLGLPRGILRALKNAGEKSQSVGGPGISVSPKGAVGVMQFMPGTAKEYGLTDPTDPAEAIPAAGKFVADMVKRGIKDPELIAAAYNSGPNRKDIREGRVPKIPETQKYVQRVTEYMGKLPDDPPKSLNLGGFSVDDLTPEDKLALMKQQGIEPTSGMSTTGRALAAVGKSINDNVVGAGQFLSDAVLNPVSQALVGKDIVDSGAIRGRVREAEGRDKDLMSTGAGLGGYMAGQVAQTALPASWISRLGPVQALANTARAVPLAKAAIPLAVSGGALSTIQPVMEDGDRATNMAIGAVAGPAVTGVLGAAGQAARYAGDKTGVSDLVRRGVGALPEVPVLSSLLRPSWSAQATLPEKRAVSAAFKNDVPVYRSQLETPGSQLYGGRQARQAEAFDRAVAKSFGQDTSDLASAFRNSAEQHSAIYNGLLSGRQIPLDRSHLADLNAIGQYNAARSPRFAPSAELQDAVDRAIQAARQNPTMSGKDYQTALSGYKAEMQKALRGSETSPPDHYAAQGYSKLIDALTKQAEKVMSPEELRIFRQTNKEFRNRSILEAIAPRELDGSINPKKLANTLARKDKKNFLYGRGGNQELSDLARYGATYMGLDSTAPSGLIKRGRDFARSTAPILAGDVAGAYVMGSAMSGEHGGDEDSLEKILKYGALGLGVHGALTAARSGLNPRLLPQDLKAPRGALGEWYARSQPGTGAALTFEAMSRGDD